MPPHAKSKCPCKNTCKSPCKNQSKSKSSLSSCIVQTKPYVKPCSKSYCDCTQLFYAPLPNLPSKPPTQTIGRIEWFAPGSVQSCCSICSSVKPRYDIPCTGYCCK